MFIKSRIHRQVAQSVISLFQNASNASVNKKFNSISMMKYFFNSGFKLNEMLMHAASQITIIKLIILSLAIFAVDSPMRDQHPGHMIFLSQSEASIWSSQVQSSPCPALQKCCGWFLWEFLLEREAGYRNNFLGVHFILPKTNSD